MDAIVVLLIVAVVAAVVLVVSAPLRHRGEATDPAAERLVALELRKQAKYREIRDAEGDFRAGKLSERDYRELDRALRVEAIAILHEIEAVEGGARGAEPPAIKSD